MSKLYTYIGTPSLTMDIKSGGVPTGKLETGDLGYAKPVDPFQPAGFWRFISLSGFETTCPKHDLVELK